MIMAKMMITDTGHSQITENSLCYNIWISPIILKGISEGANRRVIDQVSIVKAQRWGEWRG